MRRREHKGRIGRTLGMTRPGESFMKYIHLLDIVLDQRPKPTKEVQSFTEQLSGLVCRTFTKAPDSLYQHTLLPVRMLTIHM